MTIKISRRDFLKISGVSSSGLILGFGGLSAHASSQSKDFHPNAFVLVEPNNQVTVWSARPEMGQGTKTALATVIAEELDIDVNEVSVKHATTDPKFGYIGVGGSWGLQGKYTEMREAGAKAKMMLLAAAAKVWDTSIDHCAVKNGMITNTANQQTLSYGELAELAAMQSVPEQVTLKPVSEFTQIGQDIKRIDNANIVQGKTTFGIDFKLPGMLYASIERCPHPDGKVASFDAKEAKKVSGVIDVVKIDGSGFPASILVHEGIAVLATNHFSALKARKLLKVNWQQGKDSGLSSAKLDAAFEKMVNSSGNLAARRGDKNAAMASADEVLSETYRLPFLSHASLEAPNATAVVDEQKCELWCGIQSASKLQGELERRFSFSKENIIINPLLCGGSFGRRLEIGYGVEAAVLAQQFKKPVQVLWSREDDMRFGQYRTASMHKMGATIKNKQVTSFYETAAILSVAKQQGMTDAFKEGVDTYYSDGPSFNYGFDNTQFEQHISDHAIPVSWWRGVGPTNYAFAYESWMDELAHKTNQDPLAFRIAQLEQMKAKYLQKPLTADYFDRIIAVLNKAADEAGWTEKKADRALGIACYVFGGRTPVANVVEVSRDGNGQVKVDKITMATECGLAVNPDIVKAQFEGGAIFGLSTVFHQAITVENGAVVEGNFDTFPSLRMPETPEFSVHILPSTREPQGVGEPCVMAIAPAVTNALFALTGKRIRNIPVDINTLA